MTSDDTINNDLEGLRKEFAGTGFTSGTVWVSAGAGPDARLIATREGMLITAWNAAELRVKVRQELHTE